MLTSLTFTPIKQAALSECAHHHTRPCNTMPPYSTFTKYPKIYRRSNWGNHRAPVPSKSCMASPNTIASKPCMASLDTIALKSCMASLDTTTSKSCMASLDTARNLPTTHFWVYQPSTYIAILASHLSTAVSRVNPISRINFVKTSLVQFSTLIHGFPTSSLLCPRTLHPAVFVYINTPSPSSSPACLSSRV